MPLFSQVRVFGLNIHRIYDPHASPAALVPQALMLLTLAASQAAFVYVLVRCGRPCCMVIWLAGRKPQTSKASYPSSALRPRYAEKAWRKLWAVALGIECLRGG